VALGGLLVIVCVLAYAYGAVRLGDRMQVLVVARSVSAGQVITAADLAEASAAKDSRVRLIPATDAVQVVGRTAVVPLVAGMLLTPNLIGDAAFPPQSKVTASLALKPGQYPQGLAAGARVVVYVAANAQAGQPAPAASSTPNSSVPASLPAVVLGVDLAGDGQGATVVTLLLDATDGPRLAAAPSGSVVLMQTPPQGG
jgi:hypothetical protein